MGRWISCTRFSVLRRFIFTGNGGGGGEYPDDLVGNWATEDDGDWLTEDGGFWLLD